MQDNFKRYAIKQLNDEQGGKWSYKTKTGWACHIGDAIFYKRENAELEVSRLNVIDRSWPALGSLKKYLIVPVSIVETIED